MERVGAGGQGFMQDAVTPDVFEADAARLVLVEVVGGDRSGAQGADARDQEREPVLATRLLRKACGGAVTAGSRPQRWHGVDGEGHRVGGLLVVEPPADEIGPCLGGGTPDLGSGPGPPGNP